MRNSQTFFYHNLVGNSSYNFVSVHGCELFEILVIGDKASQRTEEDIVWIEIDMLGIGRYISFGVRQC